MCRIFGVSESGFYAWRVRAPSERERENARLEIEIKAAHQRTRETYSATRLHSDLADHGVQATPYRVRTLRKKLGLRCKQNRKFKVTTDSKHRLPIAPNVLKREFTVSAPNKAWVSDITYISTDEGWLYLAGIKELFNGELVGYSMSERMTKNLVIQALFRATAKKRPPIGLILHSDRGSQYCAHDYQNLLKQFGMTASMSRKGDCWDNAPIESFWGILKNELVHHRKFKTRQQAIQEITEYIEIFYNRQRKQKRLRYLSPAAFTQQYYEKLIAA
ncbi:putative transposase [Nitrosomonas cryotolerans ATCC 49181]|uniref:Putative transposase n=3 Tax=Nitrosomonas cryotolerans TaxID=44575 RepID=A0A1N6HGR9_9PROT|nr:putative transposase [Nitrosomonas cryotolerans ATCC 49181]